MQKKILHSGFSIDTIGLGTWQIGGKMESDYSDDKNAIDNMKRVLDSGITLIDTAELYGGGHTEELIGEAISGRDRSQICIASKVLPQNQNYKNLIESAEKSLERLRTDYLDLYILHMPSHDIPFEETMDAMNFLLEKGLIRNIGVSNFTKESLEKAQKVSKGKIVLNQCHYSLIFREPEINKLDSYCVENDIILQAWRPLQYGDIVNNPEDILISMAKKYNKTVGQIAINWLISQQNVTTIIKMTKQEHITENLGALGWELEKEDIELLREKFPNQEKISRVPMQ